MDPYDRIADEYQEARDPSWGIPLVDALLAPLDGRLHVLDLGCGTGIPIARRVLDAGHRVTAVDRSAAMLERARRRVPEARLLRADLRTVRFRPGSFDAVMAWDGRWTTPRSGATWRES